MTSVLDKLTREDAINKHYTPEGVQVRIHKVANSSLVRVAFSSGGELPAKLSGMWTSAQLAEKDIRDYLEERWEAADFKERNVDSDGNPRKGRPTKAQKEELEKQASTSNS